MAETADLALDCVEGNMLPSEVPGLSLFAPFGLDAATLEQRYDPWLQRFGPMAGSPCPRYARPRPLPPGEPVGTFRALPNIMGGLALVEDPAGRMIPLWPEIELGAQFTVEIDALYLSEDRRLAIVEARLPGGVVVHYFDQRFLAERPLYWRGARHDVLFTGVPTRFETWTADEAAQVAAALSGAIASRVPELASRVDASGMAAMLPGTTGARNAYTIVGPVKDIRPVEDGLLGAPCWRVRVEVARPGGGAAPFRVDILLGAVLLNGRDLPQIGGMVTAEITLFGSLSMTINVRPPAPAVT